MTPQKLAPPLAVTPHSTTNLSAGAQVAAREWIAPTPASIYVGLLNDLGAAAESGAQLPQVIGLTSCDRGEGVSTVAANLAWVAAHSLGAKVLLIDAHLAAPSLARVANLPQAKGLTDFLGGDSELLDCLHEAPRERLWYLPVGLHRAADVLGRENLEALFEQVRDSFDLIVIDLPPVVDWNNCATFAQHADGVLLVVGTARVSPVTGRNAVAALRRKSVEVLGVVLNGGS